MSRALKLLVDNHNRDPNNLNPTKKRPPPIRFFRSVGLQVNTEPPFRTGPTKVIHVNHDSPMNGMKTMNGGTVLTFSQNGQPMKSTGKTKLPQGNSPAHLVRVVNGQSQTSSKGPSNGSQIHNTNILRNTTQQINGNTSPAKTITLGNSIASPTVVDLTDDPTVSMMTSNGM
jgi:hypothetical protein